MTVIHVYLYVDYWLAELKTEIYESSKILVFF